MLASLFIPSIERLIWDYVNAHDIESRHCKQFICEEIKLHLIHGQRDYAGWIREYEMYTCYNMCIRPSSLPDQARGIWPKRFHHLWSAIERHTRHPIIQWHPVRKEIVSLTVALPTQLTFVRKLIEEYLGSSWWCEWWCHQSTAHDGECHLFECPRRAACLECEHDEQTLSGQLKHSSWCSSAYDLAFD
jgi:hypothetical protein